MTRSLYAIVFLTILTAIAANGQALPFDIEFAGNTKFTSELLRSEFAKCPYNLAKRETDEDFKQGVSLCLRGTVFELYSSKGMLGLQTTSDIEIKKTYKERLISVKILEPEPTYFHRFSLKRSTYSVTGVNQLEESFPVKEGELADIATIRRYFHSIRTTYYNAGRLDFDLDFDLETIVDEQGRKNLNIIATLDEGGPFIISEVRFQRASEYRRLSDDELLEALNLKLGEVYDERRLQAGLERLNSICKLCDLASSRTSNAYTNFSSSSRNLEISQDNEDRTVKLIIRIFEHPDF